MNEIIIVGNPNTGKTTLFNTITKSRERVSNWHGVTVGAKSKKFKYKNNEYILTDLPGIYSLNGYSNEEKIACNYLKNNPNKLIINICDANNIIRNLKLTNELLKNNHKIIIAINMAKENKLINYNKLSKEYGVEIIEIDARKKHGILSLLDSIYFNTNQEKVQNIDKLIKKHTQNSDKTNKFAKNESNVKFKQKDKIDLFILNKFVFMLLFVSLMFLFFYIVFGPVGSGISTIFNMFFKQIIDYLRKIINCLNISSMIKIFIFETIFFSFEAILSFLPELLLMMLFLNMLEDSGIMSRVAFMFDGILQKIGLSGKSLFSIMLGYGCSTTAIITTRNLENYNLRKRTALLIPFSSCSAKLPIYLIIVSLFFEKYKYLFVFLFYIFSNILQIIFAAIFNKFIPSKNNFFIMEMPKLRTPNFKKIFMDSFQVLLDFIKKISTTILFFSVVVWLLKNFSIRFSYLAGENFNESILYYFSKIISPIFNPIGLGNPGIVAALLMGLVAKEMVVVGLAMINGVSGYSALVSSLTLSSSVCNFTPLSAIVFLIFVLLYPPCHSALSVIHEEFGFKFSLFVFVFQVAVAYVSSLLFRVCYLNMGVLIFILMFIVVDIFISIMIKSNKKKVSCKGDCHVCRKI